MMRFSLLNSKNFNIINYTIASHVYSESDRENMFFTDQRIGNNIIFLINISLFESKNVSIRIQSAIQRYLNRNSIQISLISIRFE